MICTPSKHHSAVPFFNLPFVRFPQQDRINSLQNQLQPISLPSNFGVRHKSLEFQKMSHRCQQLNKGAVVTEVEASPFLTLSAQLLTQFRDLFVQRHHGRSGGGNRERKWVLQKVRSQTVDCSLVGRIDADHSLLHFGNLLLQPAAIFGLFSQLGLRFLQSDSKIRSSSHWSRNCEIARGSSWSDFGETLVTFVRSSETEKEQGRYLCKFKENESPENFCMNSKFSTFLCSKRKKDEI